MYRCFACIKVCSEGSLSNDDSDFNENGIKAIGFDWQNNNSLHVLHAFSYIS